MNSKLMQRFTHSIFILSGIFTLVILIAIVGFILFYSQNLWIQEKMEEYFQ